MKRSKVLEDISEILYESALGLNDGFKESWLDDADKILSHLEKLGMQPPNIALEQLIPGDLKTAPEAEKHWYACWEPEND